MSGLTGKKYIGKIVKGFDPDGRGRYKVHIPEILQHTPETVGIFCMNEVNGSRISGSSRGMSGTYKPLYEGQRVGVVFTTDDINSARIIEVIGDEQESMTPSIKKICCGDTGQIEKERTAKTRSSLPIKLDINQITNQFNELLNTARSKFGAIVDKVNELNVKLTREQELKKINNKEDSNNKKRLKSTDSTPQKITYDSYFKDTYGREPTSSESELMQIAGGVKTVDKYVVEKKQDWEKTEPENITNKSKDGSRDLDNTSKDEGIATAQESQEDRDEETIIAMTPNKSAIAITEKSSSNPDSILIVHKGKQTAIKMNDDGIYISTDLNSFSRICINRDIQIDGTSSITVNGGNYDIYVNGKININSTGDINLSTDSNMNINVGGNINVEVSGDINTKVSNSSTKISGDINIKSDGKASIVSSDNLILSSNNELQAQGSSKFSAISSGYVALDGSKVLINSGASSSPSIPDVNIESVPKAQPAKRSVCKL